LICELPTLFLGNALTAATDVPPSAKNQREVRDEMAAQVRPDLLQLPVLEIS